MYKVWGDGTPQGRTGQDHQGGILHCTQREARTSACRSAKRCDGRAEYDEKRQVEYPFELLDELELAYAITVHKSQGSEYPAVVIPLLPGPKLLYNRNLLYTAVTRAKKCLTIVGSEDTFQEMIKNKNEQERYTSLDERIQEF